MYLFLNYIYSILWINYQLFYHFNKITRTLLIMTRKLKNQRRTLTIADKLKILDLLDNGDSIRKVAFSWNVPRSTVFNIKKKGPQIKKYMNNRLQINGK